MLKPLQLRFFVIALPKAHVNINLNALVAKPDLWRYNMTLMGGHGVTEGLVTKVFFDDLTTRAEL